MNKRTWIIFGLLLLASLMIGSHYRLFAQSPVPISASDKMTITVTARQVAALQQQAVIADSEYKTKVADLQWQYGTASAQLAAKINDARKHLGLPDTAQFNFDSFSFTVAAPKPPAATEPAPRPAGAVAPPGSSKN